MAVAEEVTDIDYCYLNGIAYLRHFNRFELQYDGI